MFDAPIRQIKDHWLHPVVVLLGHTSPMLVSITACVAGLAAAWLAWTQCYEWAVPMWLFNRLLDGLDGALARWQGTQSDFGGYVDILLDFVVYSAMPLGVAYSTPTSSHHLIVGLLLAVYYLNAGSWIYLSALIEKQAANKLADRPQTSITMPVTLIGGTETVIAYVLFLLFPSAFAWLAGIFSLLIVIGIIQRLLWAAKKLKIEN